MGQLFDSFCCRGVKCCLSEKEENDLNHLELFAPDDRFLGRVTVGKNETCARLIDAGLHIIAIVNESLPIHDIDSGQGMADDANPSIEDHTKDKKGEYSERKKH
ncbi:MAG: hypothetical protein PUD44_06415 [Clostridiaceae bacterium]|nr:hypothetical protein [Clostridiaceae bacterium]